MEVEWLRRADGYAGRVRGAAAEERLVRVLLAGPRLRWVTGVRLALAHEDGLGIDVVVSAGREPPCLLQVKCGLAEAIRFVPTHPEGIGVVVAPPELDEATALGRALGVLIMLREGRCTRAAMLRVLMATAAERRGAAERMATDG